MAFAESTGLFVLIGVFVAYKNSAKQLQKKYMSLISIIYLCAENYFNLINITFTDS